MRGQSFFTIILNIFQLIIPIRNRLNASGGPIQLWQFLVEMLLDRQCKNCITWTGKEWEFRMGNLEFLFFGWYQYYLLIINKYTI